MPSLVPIDFNVERKVKMGLGEAILRLVHVELKYANGVFDLPDHLKDERGMIVEALNQYELDLGFNCNTDSTSVPDDVGIFEHAAATSCCRIFQKDTSRRRPEPPVDPEPIVPAPVVAAVEVAPPTAVAVPAVKPTLEVPTTPRRRDLSRRK